MEFRWTITFSDFCAFFSMHSSHSKPAIISTTSMDWATVHRAYTCTGSRGFLSSFTAVRFSLDASSCKAVAQKYLCWDLILA